MSLNIDNKSSRLFKALMGVSETRLSRDFFEEPIRTKASVLPNQIWKYGDKIPTGDDSAIIAIIRSMSNNATYDLVIDEATTTPIVKKYVDLTFSAIDPGTDNAFQLLDNDLNSIGNIIPFNFGDGISYNYSLKKKTGQSIAFGTGDWVLDTQSGVLTFYGDVPSGVDAQNPPKITLYTYIGGMGIPETMTGKEGAIIPLENVVADGSRSNWTSNDTGISELFNDSLNNVVANFIDTFGWDGSDTNEGVAISYEKLLPLRNTESKDAVKCGIGTDKDSGVDSLVSTKLGATTFNGLSLEFISNGMEDFTLNYEDASRAVSIDGGSSVAALDMLPENALVKLTKGANFVVLRRTSTNLPTQDMTESIVLSEGINIGFFYWDTVTTQNIPFMPIPDTYDFSVPIVLKIGRIPPSVKLNQTSTGGFTDSITPNYYGTRGTAVVMSVIDSITANNSDSPEGSDYIVKNKPGFYLEDMLVKLFNDHPSFKGTVRLRNGRYIFSSDFNLNDIDVVFEGEGSVIIQSLAGANINSISTEVTDTELTFKDITFIDAMTITSQADSGKAYLTLDNCIMPSVDIVAESMLTIVNCPTIKSLAINKAMSVIGDRTITNSTIGAITLNGSHNILRGVNSDSVIGTEFGTNSIIDSNYFEVLTSLDNNNQFSNNTVLTYGVAVAERYTQLTGMFEIVDTTDADGVHDDTLVGNRRFTKFDEAGPVIYDTLKKRFDLLLDPYTLEIEDGKLKVVNIASHIIFDPTNAARPYDDYEVGSVGPDVTADNVQDALMDLYQTKADLINGKLPLQQLPEAITHGGLSFRGLWQFEDNGGLFPTYADVEMYNKETVVEWADELQPGWFVVIANSHDTDNPAFAQDAADGVKYTSGDWAIYTGEVLGEAVWAKIDNSVADAVYSILPSTPPDANNWDEASGGDGLLSLGSRTLVEATDQINEILKKLAPAKPIQLDEMEMHSWTDGEYTTMLSETQVEITEAFDNRITTSIDVGTAERNGIVDDINTLFFDGDHGTVSGFMNAIAIGDKELTFADDSGTYGELTITNDADPYLNIDGKQNFWKGLRAYIRPAVNNLGKNTYKMTHSITGETEYDVYLDDPIPAVLFDPEFSGKPVMSRMLSGVPTAIVGGDFTVASLKVTDVVGVCYPKIAANVVSNIGHDYDLLTNTSLVTFPIIGEKADAITDSSVSTITGEVYEENVEFSLTPFNSKNEEGTVVTLPSGIRVDTTLESPNAETLRVRSGNGTEVYPAISSLDGDAGASYDSAKSLVSAGYTQELMRLNSEYKWPTGNFESYSGPNYDLADGELIDGDEYRFVTFKSTDIVDVSALTIAVEADNTMSDMNKVTDNMLIKLSVVGAKPCEWLDCNKPYLGVGDPINNGDGAMVAGDGRTDSSSKRVTFGKKVKSGAVYIRIGIKKNSAIKIQSVKVEDLA